MKQPNEVPEGAQYWHDGNDLLPQGWYRLDADGWKFHDRHGGIWHEAEPPPPHEIQRIMPRADHPVDATDMVNNPPHYQSDSGIECIDAIRAALGKEGFIAHCRGTAIKYAFRSGKKSAHAEDLRKAAWYLEQAAKEMDG